MHCAPHVKYDNGVKRVAHEFTVMDENVLPPVLKQWRRWSVGHVELTGALLGGMIKRAIVAPKLLQLWKF
jgi:hypothetical protein